MVEISLSGSGEGRDRATYPLTRLLWCQNYFSRATKICYSDITHWKGTNNEVQTDNNSNWKPAEEQPMLFSKGS
jgi:hypothetical protein